MKINFKNTSLFLFLISAFCVAAQDASSEVKQQPISFLDSIKGTFVRHEIAECVDQRWTFEIMQQDLFQEMKADIEGINIDDKIDFELSTELLKERLKILDSKSAFDIDYNSGLENIIKHYLKNRKRSFERLMSLSQYYFPIFESSLAKYNVPLEIKYLAIVESALNPRAVSKAGATGIWQFMYATGKQYNLDVTTFIDERSDILKATEAACQYMVNMYAIFGDWDLVLASYNAGPGNVTKAIRRSGGKQNYWNIRPFLPKETQGYVPAFLATMYIYEFHKEHGIIPQKAVINTFETDTIQVKGKMSFKQISEVLDIPVAELQFLNPSFKRDFIPFINDKKHYLRLPQNKIALLTSNEDKFYAYLDYDFNRREKPYSSMEALANADGGFQTVQNTKFHVVKKGETLGGISNKYGVSLANLKSWNGLKSNNIPIGRKLKIVTHESVAVTPKPSPVKTNPTITKDTVKTQKTDVALSKSIHTVDKGESLFSIARKYNLNVDELRDWNQLDNDDLQSGQKLLLEQNSLVSNETVVTNYTVQKGDTAYLIAKKFGVGIDEVIEWNDIKNNVLSSGMVLKLYNVEEAASKVEKTSMSSQSKPVEVKDEKHYVVKKGDSLFSISQKIPGITVADLKKWNGISGSTVIKPGMKLKISG